MISRTRVGKIFHLPESYEYVSSDRLVWLNNCWENFLDFLIVCRDSGFVAKSYVKYPAKEATGQSIFCLRLILWFGCFQVC